LLSEGASPRHRQGNSPGRRKPLAQATSRPKRSSVEPWRHAGRSRPIARVHRRQSRESDCVRRTPWRRP
jgi:hypothetical protein